MAGESTVGWAKINFVASDTTVKLSNLDFPSNADISDDGSGTLHAEGLALTRQDLVASCTTAALETIFDNIPLLGQCVKAAATIEAVDLISRKTSTCDAVNGATPHDQRKVAKGLLRLESLNLPRNSDATVTFLLDCFSNAGAAPWARSEVATPTGVVTERFRLYNCEIAGVQFTEIESVNIAYNVGISEKDPALGQVWAETAGVRNIRPVLTLQGRDLGKIIPTVIELLGNAATHANTTIQMIKLQDSGTFHPIASLEHIKFTIHGMVVPSSIVNASSGARATNELTLLAAFDGTNNPIVPTTDTAILAVP